MSTTSTVTNQVPNMETNPSSAPLVLTQSAAKKIQELLLAENNPHLYFRLGVTGGGCSGMQYDIMFDEKIDPEEDFLFEKNLNNDADVVAYDYETVMADRDKMHTDKIIFVVDSISINYFRGAKIDYRTNELGEGEFVINNPNAKTSCGCGSSFSTE